ncbi:hypothetical protein COW36_07400 [bacterium (Candidatus Blackallbacteria) CG17_big_fil_post_rev_8_21_14_2_50_48_46]|uniref:Uncharacterized protein n=1 Tax=bacterium (Candidatus Blackallbacteria) CG17_big_fil_post_rev_8_21_14_2_50_48_46 TaxID=2014261 RepID=A0A2M7G6U5_9BACT|nr:MAG: hypothetical protein COW64_16500 [bacterium (Candidatus Blackallbacteria) CG18_big_fil_WC_8_21_14_2_50_49_26]PIW17761.1 MAG: hypothetical protein COW36_07400 [bacterium (Candidatus Blackallbacteria) CG17_big_fil_post_rev_8_21_14_2_50_48_46]PIW47320.1 MAG: hypothetical protein COW20_12925 [bacterium (Candidatus Blackallbacteria) CG13_big_fil_rev_8_21_14_2_50_49_14]
MIKLNRFIFIIIRYKFKNELLNIFRKNNFSSEYLVEQKGNKRPFLVGQKRLLDLLKEPAYLDGNFHRIVLAYRHQPL